MRKRYILFFRCFLQNVEHQLFRQHNTTDVTKGNEISRAAKFIIKTASGQFLKINFKIGRYGIGT